jgi:hypothetical protein
MGSFNKPIDPPEQPCSSVVECTVTNPDPMAVVLLVALAGLLLVFLAFALAHIKTARSLLAEERERIAAEAEAFASFARRVGQAPSVYQRQIRTVVQVPADLDRAFFPGCVTLLGWLPPDAFRNFGEARPDPAVAT